MGKHKASYKSLQNAQLRFFRFLPAQTIAIGPFLHNGDGLLLGQESSYCSFKQYLLGCDALGPLSKIVAPLSRRN